MSAHVSWCSTTWRRYWQLMAFVLWDRLYVQYIRDYYKLSYRLRKLNSALSLHTAVRYLENGWLCCSNQIELKIPFENRAILSLNIFCWKEDTRKNRIFTVATRRFPKVGGAVLIELNDSYWSRALNKQICLCFGVRKAIIIIILNRFCFAFMFLQPFLH